MSFAHMATIREIRKNDADKKDKGDTLSSAVSVLELLPEDGRKKVLNFSIELLKDDEDNPFKPKTKEELFERIDHSLGQINSGENRDVDEVIGKIMAELGEDE